MLFDLNKPGRRGAVKVVYLTLAVLMGGGLVLFGIGSDAGGLLDAVGLGSGSNGTEVSDQLKDRVTEIEKEIDQNPKDAAAVASLVLAEYQIAGQGENYDQKKQEFTAKGRQQLRKVGEAWKSYEALNPKKIQNGAAASAVQAYGALGDYKGALAVQEAITTQKPNTSSYAQLAVLAYLAGNTQIGKAAATRAVDTAPKNQKKQVKQELQQAELIAQQQSQQQAQSQFKPPKQLPGQGSALQGGLGGATSPTGVPQLGGAGAGLPTG